METQSSSVRESSARSFAAALAVSVVITVMLLTGTVTAQDIRQLSPGLYCAGIPSDEFVYKAAPESSGKQRMTNWCWAACIQMILNFHGVEATQEEIVTRMFGTTIDKPASAEVILAALSGWAVSAKGKPVIISASPMIFKGSDIVADLAYHQPLVVGLTTPNGISHACVLTAVSYSVDQYTNEPLFSSVVIRDPWPGKSSRNEMSWMEFRSRLMFMARVRVTETSEGDYTE
ncbi:MAG: papain-like cysteine protease family protein [Vulcanimicrobiota bacterium]